MHAVWFAGGLLIHTRSVLSEFEVNSEYTREVIDGTKDCFSSRPDYREPISNVRVGFSEVILRNFWVTSNTDLCGERSAMSVPIATVWPPYRLGRAGRGSNVPGCR